MFCYFSFGGWKAGISKPKQTPNTLRTFPVHKYLGCSRESVVAVGADVCSPCQHLHCLAGIIGGLASEYCFVALIKSFYDCCKIFFFFFFRYMHSLPSLPSCEFYAYLCFPKAVFFLHSVFGSLFLIFLWFGDGLGSSDDQSREDISVAKQEQEWIRVFGLSNCSLQNKTT